jgi:hypothetical protein
MGQVVFIFFGTIFESADYQCPLYAIRFGFYLRNVGWRLNKICIRSLFLQDQNTSRDTRSVKNIGRHTNHGIEVILFIKYWRM